MEESRKRAIVDDSTPVKKPKLEIKIKEEPGISVPIKIKQEPGIDNDVKPVVGPTLVKVKQEVSNGETSATPAVPVPPPLGKGYTTSAPGKGRPTGSALQSPLAQAITQEGDASSAPSNKMHCALCDCTFTSKGLLRKHSYACHFRCTTCAATYVDRAGLVAHCTTVHKVEPTTCFVCDRIFALKHDYRQHYKQSHHKCSACPAMFPRRNLMLEHLKSAHQVALFGCELCRKEFRYEIDLYNHLQCDRHAARLEELNALA